jgi:hypothetical protein
MLREEIFPSRYYKAPDLPKPINAEIAAAAMTDLQSPQGLRERKLVLSFKGPTKRLVVNRTNFDAIAALYGHNTDGWIGKSIQLFATKTFVRGKETDCVRVRRAG